MMRRVAAAGAVALVLLGALGLVLRLTRNASDDHRARPSGAAQTGGETRGSGGRRTFYVSPSGHDSGAGTSPRTAWRTVTAVDRAHLKPGDTVLFRGGATFADDTLMPGEGTLVSGAADAPITFGSYGSGQASLSQGVWFRGENWLTFRNLRVGAVRGITGQGVQGTGNHIRIQALRIEHAGLAIESVGNAWTIVDNVIRDTGNSGMLLGFDADHAGDPPGGRHYLVSRNTITDTGLDRRITYGTHGIYLKVADATVTRNTITGFHDDGISIRYRNTVVTHNRISNGPIGLAWFQYDDDAGMSAWLDNRITGVTGTGIFVCGPAQGCRKPLETFSIAGNTIRVSERAGGASPSGRR